MAGKIQGITVAIDGDTSGLAKSLKSITTESVRLSKDLKTVNNLLKMDPSNAEFVAQKQKILAESIETTKKKLDALKAAQEGVTRQFENGEINTEQYLAFQKELVTTEKRLKDLETEAETASDSVDQLGDETKQTGYQMQM